MKGAREYAQLFKTGQHGRLYLVSGSHARGLTFRIYVLPEGVTARPNGPNAPLNGDAVEVYGIISGQPGWTEEYGWLHVGKWQADFDSLCASAIKQRDEAEAAKYQSAEDKAVAEAQRKAALLATYK